MKLTPTDLDTRVTNTAVRTTWRPIHETSCTPFHAHRHSSYVNILEQRGSSSTFSFYLVIWSCKAVERQLFKPWPECKLFYAKL